MGIDYSIGLDLGYEVSVDQVVKKYGKKLPEEFHMEERFDTKSGKPIDPEKVVDRPAGLYIVVGGESFDQENPDWVEALSKEWDLDVRMVCEGENGTNDGMVLMVLPNKMRFPKDVSTDCLYFGRVQADGGYEIEELAKLLPKIKKAGEKLKKLGFKVGKPMVRVGASYG